MTPGEILARKTASRCWRQGRLGWKLDTLQQRISETIRNRPKAKKICILSSRQIGKSYWDIVYSLEYLLRHKSRICRIIAPTLGNCHDIVNDNLSKIMRDAPEGLITKRRSDMRWELANGSNLRLGALERSHVDAMNRGGNASLIIYEECGFVKGDDFTYGVNSVLGPQLLRSNGLEIFVTSPSEDPDHPLHTEIVPECETLGTLFRFTVFDSPSISPQNIIEAMRRSGCLVSRSFEEAVYAGKVTSENVHRLAELTETKLSEAFRREYLAEILRPASLVVVPDYNEAKHVMDYEAPTSCFWTVTIDWGGVRDFTVALMHGYDFMGGRDLVWDEMMWPANTSTATIVADLKAWELSWAFHISERFADVFTQTMIDLTALGYPTNLPPKQEWPAPVNALSVKFTLDQILIHPRCRFLRKSLTGGIFNKSRSDFERTRDLGHMDALAALMYAIRVQNRSNPYKMTAHMPENVFVREAPKSDEERLAEAINPKTWETKRTFGGFRK